MLKAIIFDFDGVILDSVNIKVNAFIKLFDFCSIEELKEIDAYNKTCGAVSRYNKIKFCYENILKRALNKEKLEELSNKYRELTINEVKKSPFIPGIERFLQYYQNKLDLYIVSATPPKDLNEIIREKNLDIYFKNVYGTTDSKITFIKKIIEEGKYNYDEIVYIGDSISDLIDSNSVGIQFIGIGKSFKNIRCIINDIRELEENIL